MRFLPLFLLLASCSSYIASMQEEKNRFDISYDQMRIEIADLKHALHATQIELNILEEKVKTQSETIINNNKNISKIDFQQKTALIEKKIASLQVNQEQTLQDLLQLRNHANDTTKALQSFAQEIQSQNRKFEEISKLKATLSSLSKAIESDPQQSFRSHRVQPGETLEKIARTHHTSVPELKKLNKLDSDRIMVGQEIKIP